MEKAADKFEIRAVVRRTATLSELDGMDVKVRFLTISSPLWLCNQVVSPAALSCLALLQKLLHRFRAPCFSRALPAFPNVPLALNHSGPHTCPTLPSAENRPSRRTSSSGTFCSRSLTASASPTLLRPPRKVRRGRRPPYLSALRPSPSLTVPPRPSPPLVNVPYRSPSLFLVSIPLRSR